VNGNTYEFSGTHKIKTCLLGCLSVQFTSCDICVDTSCSNDSQRMVFVLSASIVRLVHIIHTKRSLPGRLPLILYQV
jgi:hypothetical protein